MSPTDPDHGSSLTGDGQGLKEDLLANPGEILPQLLADTGMLQTVLIQVLRENSLGLSIKIVILQAFEGSSQPIIPAAQENLVSLLENENAPIRCGIYRLIRDGKITIDKMELIKHAQEETDTLARCYAIEALTVQRVREAIPLLRGWHHDLGASGEVEEEPGVQAIRAALHTALSVFD